MRGREESQSQPLLPWAATERPPGLQLSLLSTTSACWKSQIRAPQAAELAPTSHAGPHADTARCCRGSAAGRSVTGSQQIRLSVLIYVSVSRSFCFSASSPPYTTSKAAPRIWLKNWSLCFFLTSIGRCAVTQIVSSAFITRPVRCIYSCKSSSLPGTTHLLPQAQAVTACQLTATLDCRGWEGCEALGEAGTWVPAPWEIRLYEQNLGDFILQRRDCSPGASGSVTASYLLPGGSHGLGVQAASGICNQTKRNQNVKRNKFLSWLKNKIQV